MREIERAIHLLKAPLRVVILTHTRPDGDAIASLLSLCVSLQAVGFDVTGVLPEGIPKRFRFLQGEELVKSGFPDDAGLVIAVDCADVKRLGLPTNSPSPKVDINIDHHISNSNFASVNIVDVKAAATTQLIYELLIAMKIPIDTVVATQLLTGLVTDTIGFRTENVTADVLRFAAKLQDLGAPLADIQMRALNERSFEAVRYWGCGLNRLSRDNGVVWTCLERSDRDRTGYPGLDDADLINIMSTIEDTLVAVIFVEQPGEKVKVSWRSKGGINVSNLANRFGGGGHNAAAGAMIVGDLHQVTQSVLDATFEVVKERAESKS